MAAPRQPYWELISVLFSSVPLEPEVAWALYDSACELIDSGNGDAKLHTDAVSGRIEATGHAVIGTIAGPAFEASVSTPEHGKAEVRFLVTHAGVEAHEARSRKPSREHMN